MSLVLSMCMFVDIVVMKTYKDGLHYHKIALQQYTECQYGLLREFQSRQILTSQQLIDVECLNYSPGEQNRKLLEFMTSLEDKKQLKELCNSFIDTKQSHLVPYFTGYHSRLYKLLINCNFLNFKTSRITLYFTTHHLLL